MAATVNLNQLGENMDKDTTLRSVFLTWPTAKNAHERMQILAVYNKTVKNQGKPNRPF